MSFITTPLHKKHQKNSFLCGYATLDYYIQKQANQDIKRKLATCFVLPNGQNEVIGYYTLSSASIEQKFIPENIQKKLPPTYQYLPVTLLGRLAVHQNQQGKKLGEKLLIDALKRSFEVSTVIGSMAVIVDPIDAKAINFYKKYGFILLPDSGKMFIAMKTIEQLFAL